jgi:hypothetical protein
MSASSAAVPHAVAPRSVPKQVGRGESRLVERTLLEEQLREEERAHSEIRARLATATEMWRSEKARRVAAEAASREARADAEAREAALTELEEAKGRAVAEAEQLKQVLFAQRLRTLAAQKSRAEIEGEVAAQREERLETERSWQAAMERVEDMSRQIGALEGELTEAQARANGMEGEAARAARETAEARRLLEGARDAVTAQVTSKLAEVLRMRIERAHRRRAFAEWAAMCRAAAAMRAAAMAAEEARAEEASAATPSVGDTTATVSGERSPVAQGQAAAAKAPSASRPVPAPSATTAVVAAARTPSKSRGARKQQSSSWLLLSCVALVLLAISAGAAIDVASGHVSAGDAHGRTREPAHEAPLGRGKQQQGEKQRGLRGSRFLRPHGKGEKMAAREEAGIGGGSRLAVQMEPVLAVLPPALLALTPGQLFGAALSWIVASMWLRRAGWKWPVAAGAFVALGMQEVVELVAGLLPSIG